MCCSLSHKYWQLGKDGLYRKCMALLTNEQKKMKWDSRNSSQNKSHLLISDKVKVKATQSCLTLCNPIDYTVHEPLQAKILEWVAYPFSRGSSRPRDRTGVCCIAGRFFTNWAIREALISDNLSLNDQLTCWALTSCQVIFYECTRSQKKVVFCFSMFQ